MLKSLIVGGMLLGSWAGLDGVDEGGGVGGRGRKKGILRGETSGELFVLWDSASSSVVLLAVASEVLLLLEGSWIDGFAGAVAVAASEVLAFLGTSALCEAPFVAVLSDEADTDTEDSSVLLLPRGDSWRSGISARLS